MSTVRGEGQSAKLLQQADENKGDAASEYVLLRDARDLAVAAGDVANSATAQKRLRAVFNFDFAAIAADLKRLDATAKTEASAVALASLYSATGADALDADNFDQAVRFELHVDDLLPLLKDAALKSRYKTEIATAQAFKRDSVAALAASKTLAMKPDDPEANLAAGKFALQRGKFETAFALLAKGKDAALSGLAKREAAAPTDAAEQVKLADGWFERAEKEPYTALKAPMQERARTWYDNALPALSGLAKVKVAGRLKELPAAQQTGAAAKVRNEGLARLIVGRWKVHEQNAGDFEIAFEAGGQGRILNHPYGGDKDITWSAEGDEIVFKTPNTESRIRVSGERFTGRISSGAHQGNSRTGERISSAVAVSGPASAFDPVGRWRKGSDILTLNADHTLVFGRKNLAGTWHMDGSKLLWEMEKYGSSVCRIIDTDTFIERDASTFTRVNSKGDSTPGAPVAIAVPKVATGNGTNLLKLIDPAKDTISGNFEWSGDALHVASDKKEAFIKVPFAPPAEYDLHAVFARTSGRGDIHVGIVCAGQPVLVSLGGYNNSLGGLDAVDGKSYADNPTKTAMTISNDTDHDLLVEVRLKSIRVNFDQKQLFTYTFEEPKFSWGAGMKGDATIALGARKSQTLFKVLEIWKR